MMKNNFSFILCLLLSINIYSQEKNNIIKGDDLRKVFFQNIILKINLILMILKILILNPLTLKELKFHFV